MAKLVLSVQGRVLSEFELDKENVTIGRKPDNDILIDNLAVSGHHAVIHSLFNQSFLEDLGSTNGTFVNGERITKHVIKEGDLILVGKHELKYVTGVVAEEDDNPFDRTVVIRAPFADTTAKPTVAAHGPLATQIIPPARPPAPTSVSTALIAKVAILSGPDKGKEFAFTKPVTAFGKKGVQVATISQKPDGYHFSHVEGPSTPTVNGEHIGNRSVLLREYDILEVAGIKMAFLVGAA